MMRKAGLAVAALGFSAISLQGCGGSSGGGGDTTTTTTEKPGTTTTTTPKASGPIGPQKAQDFVPVRGVAYDARPYKSNPTIPPGLDMMQTGYEAQFHTMRDDLGVLRMMGASSVRVYAGIGSETESDHSKFLDRCSELGLNVIVDFYMPGLCDKFDCSEQWKKSATTALTKQGFAKNGKYHSAVKMIMLMQEPDNLNFAGSDGSPPECPKDGDDQAKPWCRVKAVLSAFDGLLMAEEEAKVDGKGVYVGVAWSWTQRKSLDGVETAELYGFADMVYGIKHPSKADYAFQTEMDYTTAFADRWVHAINSPAAWDFIKEKVHSRYENYKNQKLLISQMTPDDASGTQDLVKDLQSLEAETKTADYFLGVVVQGFQTDYIDPVAFQRMFALGDDKLTDKMQICNTDARSGAKICNPFPLYCLDKSKGKHSDDIAKAWGGSIDGNAVGMCKSKEVEYVEVSV